MTRRRTSANQITIAEVVRRLNVTLVTVYSWLRGSNRRARLDHLVEAFGTAHRIFIPEQALVNWLSQYRPDLLQRWIT